MNFSSWFFSGLFHIADWQAYDHILFLLSLCCIYLPSDWKKVLLLLTAFTIGHSTTLALSTINLIHIKSTYIEFFIPLSILVTCLYNLYCLKKIERNGFNPSYFLALFFGFIHGLAFSFLLKSLLGAEEYIFIPLFYFNLGLEVGQLLVVLIIFVLLFFLQKIFKFSNYNKTAFLSLSVFSAGFIMAIQRLQLLITE